MTFRRRITLVSAAAVAVAVVLASILVYILTSEQLHRQVDQQLRGRSRAVLFVLQRAPEGGARERALRAAAGVAGPFGGPDADALTGPRGVAGGGVTGVGGAVVRGPFPALTPAPDEVRGYQQVIDGSGRVLYRSVNSETLPVTPRAQVVAARGGSSFFGDATVAGTHLRVLTEAAGRGRAVQLAQPLTDVDSLLSRLRLILVAIDAGGIALAALLGLFVAGAALAPIKRLIRASEHVTQTRDLSQRITPTGEDEIGRLAESFNAMLDALETSMQALDASVSAQRQLVADASHELRTPVTSVRTNVEILLQAQDMDPGDRQRLLREVIVQIEELTLLMNDLIELARGEAPRDRDEDVRLDLMVVDAIARARRHAPDAAFAADLDETLILGDPARLDRAVNNLLDNAVKYSPPGQPIEVTLRDGELRVRDHGPGFSTQDLPHVFDRFYRGAEARGRPGSGLGLAIVQQVADAHGGSISAEAAPGGGALMRLRLQLAPAEPPESADGPQSGRTADPAPLV
jgi:two-component system sensor histidine kinase MprB